MPVMKARYYRLSQDRDDNFSGIERQRSIVEPLSERRWPNTTPVDYVDNDISAWDKRKRRPEWERLLADLQSGTVTGLLAYDLDRLLRQPRDLERLIDVCEGQRIADVATAKGDLDLTDSDGRLKARILAAAAAKSSDDTSRRVELEKAHRARIGANHGGSRQFGYTSDRAAFVPAEADLLRTLAHRALAGESVNALLHSLPPEAHGTHGRPFSAVSLRQLLLSPSIAGLRVYRGEVVGDAAWEGIITPAEHRRLVGLLGGDRRRLGGPRPARSYWLAGLLVCGVCGRMLVSHPRTHRGKSVRRYMCYFDKTGGCNKVSITADPLEELIGRLILDVIQEIPQPGRDGGRVEELDLILTDMVHVETELADWANLRATRQVTVAEWQVATTTLRAQLIDLNTQLAQLPTRHLDPSTLSTLWPTLPAERKQQYAQLVFQSITIAEAGSRRGLSPDQVDRRRLTVVDASGRTVPLLEGE